MKEKAKAQVRKNVASNDAIYGSKENIYNTGPLASTASSQPTGSIPGDPVYGSSPWKPSQSQEQGLNKRFIATPIVLGNPVYGNPNPIKNDPNRKFGEGKPKQFRRKSSEESANV